MCTKFEASGFSRRRDIEEFAKFKSRSHDLDYVSFGHTFVLFIFYSLQSVYMLNLKPIALAVSELFTVVHSQVTSVSTPVT